jgi:hypothetical protein
MDLQNRPRPGAPQIPGELLCRAGSALYGPLWESFLGMKFGVSARTITRWRQRETIAPRMLAHELLGLVEAKITEGENDEESDEEERQLLYVVAQDLRAYEQQRLDFEQSQG